METATSENSLCVSFHSQTIWALIAGFTSLEQPSMVVGGWMLSLFAMNSPWHCWSPDLLFYAIHESIITKLSVQGSDGQRQPEYITSTTSYEALSTSTEVICRQFLLLFVFPKGNRVAQKNRKVSGASRGCLVSMWSWKALFSRPVKGGCSYWMEAGKVLRCATRVWQVPNCREKGKWAQCSAVNPNYQR